MVAQYTNNNILFRVDDVEDISLRFNKITEILEKKNIVYVLGVIPNNVSSSMKLALGNLRYAVIFQHGFCHRSPLGTYQNEFPSTMAYNTIKLKMSKGAKIIENIIGKKPKGYIPPWNHLSSSAEKVLGDLDFHFISSKPSYKKHSKLLQIGSDFDPVLCYNPYDEMGINDIQSLFNNNVGNATILTVTLHLKFMSNELFEFLMKYIEEKISFSLSWDEIINIYRSGNS